MSKRSAASMDASEDNAGMMLKSTEPGTTSAHTLPDDLQSPLARRPAQMEPNPKKQKLDCGASTPTPIQTTTERLLFSDLPAEIRQNILHYTLYDETVVRDWNYGVDTFTYCGNVERIGLVSKAMRGDLVRLVRVEHGNTLRRVAELGEEIEKVGIAADMQRFVWMDARKLVQTADIKPEDFKTIQDKLRDLDQKEHDLGYFQYRLSRDCVYLVRFGDRIERILLQDQESNEGGRMTGESWLG